MFDFTLSTAKLKNELAKLHESDIATLFEENEKEQVKIYQALSVKRFADVFFMLNEDTQKEFYESLNIDQKKSLLKSLEIDDLKTFIEIFKLKEHASIISLLPKSTQVQVKRLLAYDENTAGSISSPHFISLSIDTSVKEATSFVTTESTDKDEIDVIFFYDESDAYVGAISLQKLIMTRANQLLKNVVNEDYPYVFEDEPVTKTVKKIRDYDIDIIPVLNPNHQMIGIITADDALTAMEEIHIDTIGEMVKVHEIDEDDSPLQRTFKRLPWLLISAILNLVIASFLSIFSQTLEANVAIVLFQPMILGMAGNIGTQSISVTILGLHQEKIEPMKHFWKEVAIGLINSAIAGLVAMGIVFIFLWILPKDYNHITELSLTVGISLAIAMFISAFSGVLLPFILRKMGADEKAASGPLISTINDFTALGTYFFVATLILMSI